MNEKSFTERLKGRFDGFVRLEDARRLAEKLGESDGWYLLEPGEALPEEAVPGEIAQAHLDGLVDEILLDRKGRWTTMVYAQSFTDPMVIKVFHPRRAGCGCGPASDIKPWWVLTRTPPESIPAWETPEVCDADAAPKGRSWWKKAV